GRRIGLWGHSAGAHLASMLGTLPAGRFEGQSGYSGTSSRVQAVLPQAAITELDRPGDFTGLDPYLTRAFPGYGSSAGLIRRLASPVTYADSSDPPFMLLHGQRDQYVSVQQPSRLYARLGGRARGHRLTIVSGASHSFAGPGQRVLRDLVDSMADFFDVHLGNGT
ncbi:MAG TPA: prolyl oligopeptidase family serine peptidase, partial [Gemmatimonadaceae bacterium]|nr:prolyl oligopeptidase family serine peptidase [Gemmatimonadaceae bacterium]